MKKLNTIDKITVVIVTLNIISFLIGIIFYNMPWTDSLLYNVVILNAFFLVFVLPICIFTGIMLNIASLIVKIKSKYKFGVNILFFVLFIFMCFGWQHFFWQALMGV